MTTPPTRHRAADPTVDGAGRTSGAMTRIRRWLDSLHLIDAMMLAVSVGGALWLVMVHLAEMTHGPARMLATLTAVVVFVRIRRPRATTPPGRPAAAPAEKEQDPAA